MAGFARYIIRRLLFVIPTFLGVAVITFVVMYAAGDPISLMRLGNPSMTPETLQNMRQFFGLDKPVPIQFLNWFWNFLHFNFGVSLRGSTPVNVLIVPWAWETLKLQFTALAIAVLVSIPIAVRSATKPYSKSDYAITTVSLFGVSMPPFWFGAILIIVFSFYLNWFPAGGAHGITQLWPTPFGTSPLLDGIIHLILPSLVIAYVWIALFIRLLRANLLEVLREDYILAARASGIKESSVVYKHALRNALTPILTFIGVRIGLVFAGSPMTETVFNWPGLGYAFVSAATELNFPIVMAIIALITIMTLASMTVTDLLYGYVDPRIKAGT